MSITWETVIGIEVHAQLTTQSKLFSGSSITYGAAANTQVCTIDAALPGTLPVLNEKVLELATRFGLSINASINRRNVFERKNYFYPDLPKGYQISQMQHPIVEHGHLDITLSDNSCKRIGITRAHLEEDAGKSIHDGLGGQTGIDLNRAGTPLLEIVSEPDMRSAEQAVAYCKTLHQLVRYLGICDGNMQEGSFRCDINISLRPHGQQEFGTRTELKNLNSFRFIEQAIHGEVERQRDLLESGQAVIQQTRLYDPDRDETRAMRSKENAHDYRYFPDPDLLPVSLEQSFIDHIQSTLPELPWHKAKRYISDLQITEVDAKVITQNLAYANYFERALDAASTSIKAKTIANWLVSDIIAKLGDTPLTDCPIQPVHLIKLLNRISDNSISNTAAKTVLEVMWQGDNDVDGIIEAKGLKQMSDSSELETIIDGIISNSPEQVAQYRAGKDKLISYFVGQVMKSTKGKANPGIVTTLLKSKLT